MTAPAIVSWLSGRAFGGRDAVAVPGSEAEQGPMGPFPAGVDDLIEHITGSYAAGPPDADQWAFLVGGPGNGKSEALRAIATSLGIASPAPSASTKAPRELTGQTSGVSVRLINDASIPREDVAGGSLAKDLSEAFEAAGSGKPILLFANVNRGVLVQESDPLSTGLAAECLSWIADAATGQSSPDAATAYYARRSFETGSRRVVVHVLSLDATSLFEPQPGQPSSLVFGGGDDPFVHPYNPLGMLQAEPGLRAGAAAAVLTSEVASPARWDGEGCADCSAASLCPFRANAAWLADNELRERFLDTCRGAEVAAGRRTTYRELLGILATAVLGRPEPEWREGGPCAWVRRLASDRSAASIGNLAGHRIYAALFPAPGPRSRIWRRQGSGRIATGDLYQSILDQFGPERAPARSAPFDKGFNIVDPAASLDGWDGKRDQVIEAAEALQVEAPVARLRDLGALPPAAIAELDHELDRIVLRVLAPAQEEREEKKAARLRDPQVRRWRSVLLHRQVGLAGAWLGDLVPLRTWLEAQQSVLEGSAGSTLNDGLRRMVAPHGGMLRLAPFRPRTRSFSNRLPARTLLVQKASSELHAEVRAVKDGLQFVLRASTGGQDVVPIAIDLDLAREAALLAQEGQGFTDLPDQAVARLERVQASLLSRTRQGRGRLSFHVTDEEGRLYSVRTVGTKLVLTAVTPGGRS